MSLMGWEKDHAEFLKENHPGRYRRLKEAGELEKVCRKQADRARDVFLENKGSLGILGAEELAFEMFITPDLTRSG